MILKKPDSFELTFTEEEKQKLNDAADLVSDLIDILNSNNLKYIRTDDEDCYIGYEINRLYGICDALRNIADVFLAEEKEG